MKTSLTMPRVAILLLLILFSVQGRLLAQPDPKTVFNTAVDHINCETIRFIHREAARSEIANNLDCSSFAGILQSIPADEAKTTGKVAHDIEDFKAKFDASKPLDAQLDAVIAYAEKRIEAKPRKYNVADYKSKLEQEKAKALALMNPQAPNNNQPTEETSSSSTTETTTAPVVETGKPTRSLDILGWLALLISVTGLVIASAALMQLRRIRNAVPASTNGEAEPRNFRNQAAAMTAEEQQEKLRRMEMSFREEIQKLRSEFEDKLGNITASTGYTEPEILEEEEETPSHQATSENQQRQDFRRENFVSAAPAVEPEPYVPSTPEVPFVTPEPEVTEDEMKDEVKMPEESIQDPKPTDEITPKMPVAEGNKTSASKEEKVSPIQAEHKTPAEASRKMEATAPEPVTVHVLDEDEWEEEEEEVHFGEPVADKAFEEEDELQEPEEVVNVPWNAAGQKPAAGSIDEAEEDDESSAMPQYKYVGNPGASGDFGEEDFADSPGRNAVFEVELYEDVPDRAFFSILPYPEVTKKVLSDPDKYLSGCCNYTDNPEGKHVVILDDEGILRKEHGRWKVFQKARLHFE